MLPQWLISVNVQSQIGSLHAQCHFVPIVSCLDLHHSFTFQDIKVTNHFQHVILFVRLFFSIGTKELLPFYHAKELDVGVEKREPFYTVGGNVNWYSHYGEQYRDTP